MANEYYNYYPYTPIPTPHRPKETGGLTEDKVREIVNEKVNGIEDDIIEGDNNVRKYSDEQNKGLINEAKNVATEVANEKVNAHAEVNMLHEVLGHGIAVPLPEDADMEEYGNVFQDGISNILYVHKEKGGGEIPCIEPSGDETGVTDYNNIIAEIAKCEANGGGVIQLGTGIFYVTGDVGYDRDIFQLPTGTTVQGNGISATVVQVVKETTGSGYRALFGVNARGVTIRDFTARGEWDKTFANGRDIYDYIQQCMASETDYYFNGISCGAFCEFGANLETALGLYADVNHMVISNFPTSAFMQWKNGKHINIYVNHIYQCAGVLHAWKSCSGMYMKDNVATDTLWGVYCYSNYEQTFIGNKFYSTGKFYFLGDSAGVVDPRIHTAYPMGDWNTNTLLAWNSLGYSFSACHYMQVADAFLSSAYAGRVVDYNGYGNSIDFLWVIGNTQLPNFLSFESAKTFPILVTDGCGGCYYNIKGVNCKETAWMKGGTCVNVHTNCYLTSAYDGNSAMASTPYRGGTFKDSGYFTPRTGWVTLTTN